MLLTIIGLLAGHAKIDLAFPSKAAAVIENAATLAGISVSRRGVEQHLKAVPNAMAARTK